MMGSVQHRTDSRAGHDEPENRGPGRKYPVGPQLILVAAIVAIIYPLMTTGAVYDGQRSKSTKSGSFFAFRRLLRSS
jgi:hypothetical protein